MIGPLPTAPGGFNRVLVAIDKFTKWIEVKPVTCPKADKVLDFLDELVHRYGLPHRIITDLGSNFNNHLFWSDRLRAPVRPICPAWSAMCQFLSSNTCTDSDSLFIRTRHPHMQNEKEINIVDSAATTT
jgi:hypothetical protein